MASFVWSKEFSERSADETSAIVEYFDQHKDHLKLEGVTSCVIANISTVGVAQSLIKDCLPRVQKFSCLSVSRDALDALSQDLQIERRKRHGGLEVRLKVQRAETWPGPTTKVDAVFLMAVDPKMSDYELPGFIRRCNGWLTSGGALFVMFHDACAEWGEVMKRVVSGSDDSMYERVRKGLGRAGLDVDERKAFDFDVNTGEPNRNLLNYFLQRMCTEKEYRKFAKKLKERFPEGKVLFRTHLLVCHKKS
ncbi:hypothetical protein CAPTEDRAFT_194818 [Capitella teleta]|uniref:Methyltransferase domain-containing protein n=1 Tax=Capitella teleta TaxID=283909 RepID=R7UT50_CAPTE|nr:hypothetical protein CAPTEDRAFT_194818 [Capitella teleta]|eukprot:ELU09385.1 hypothetical protein CAPTEDRAFT_194818 [Capitella teleta]